MYEDLSRRSKKNLEVKTDYELIATFNKYVGNRGWCSAKGVYLKALQEEIETRGFQNSEIICSGGLKLNRRVVLLINRLEFASENS